MTLPSILRRLICYDRTAPDDVRLLALANDQIIRRQLQQFGRDIGLRAVAVDRDAAGGKSVVYRIPARLEIRPS